MTSLRKRKSQAMGHMFNRRWRDADLEDRLWDQMPAVGREFGSPDFERLMEEDHRNEVGSSAPALKSKWVQGA